MPIKVLLIGSFQCRQKYVQGFRDIQSEIELSCVSYTDIAMIEEKSFKAVILDLSFTTHENFAKLVFNAKSHFTDLEQIFVVLPPFEANLASSLAAANLPVLTAGDTVYEAINSMLLPTFSGPAA